MGLSSGKMAKYLSHGKPVIVAEHLAGYKKIVDENFIGRAVPDIANIPPAIKFIDENYSGIENCVKKYYIENFEYSKFFKPFYGRFVKKLFDFYRENNGVASRIKPAETKKPAIASGGGPVISVISVTLNSGETLEKTILSVGGQSYGAREYIVVDGGSSDPTMRIIKKYSGAISKFVQVKGNLSAALNKGIEMSTGDVIGIIHADDWYADGALEKAAVCFANSDADVVCGKVKYYKGEKPELIYESVPDALEKEMTVQHPSVFIKRSVYEKEGGFNEKYEYAMDYDLLLRLKLKEYRFAALDEIIANMRYGGKSDIHWIAALDEVRKIKIANGQPPVSAWLYFARQIIRKSAVKVLAALNLDCLIKFYRRHFSVVKKTDR